MKALYSNPTTYEKWTEEDWAEARRTLPDNAPYNDDGYSVPITYFKYDVDWRRYVREFQEDLADGRLEPEWQKQANEAIEARARGDFDKWKAEEFEEFWGQKQKTNSRELAGESAQVKLETLVKHSRIRVGDIISYARVFGKGKDRMLIEKDARVVKAEEGALTIGIPPGRLKYARYLPTPEQTPRKMSHNEEHMSSSEDTPVNGSSETEVKGGSGLQEASPSTPPEDAHPVPPTQQAQLNNQANDEPSPTVPTGGFVNYKPANGPQPTKTEILQVSIALASPILHDTTIPETAAGQIHSPTKDDGPNDQPVLETLPVSLLSCRQTSDVRATELITDPNLEQPSRSPQPSQRPIEDVILVTINSLTELERHMVATDGRIPMQGYRSINSWKAMRAQRDNQDMGSLFDIREAWFINQSNTIVKEPTTSRSGREIKKA